MINNYEIKKINNQEILFIYLDINNEFSFNLKEKKENIKKVIKEYIKKNKIPFMGTTVALVVGGMLIGNIDLKTSINETMTINNILFNEQVEDKQIEPYIEDNNKYIEDLENENVNNNNTYTEEQIDEKLEDTNYDNKIEEPIIEEISYQNEEIEDKIFVSVKRSNGEIVNIELEEYVIGVVGAEMPASFNEQALMAQAVIARTYALKAISRGQTLTDNNSTQNYKSNEELQNMWGNSYNTYYNKIKDAVLNTEKLYLSYNGDYIEAVYHSTSNTKTEAAVNVWGNSFPYLISVGSPYDNLNPSFIKEQKISYNDISNKLGIEINKETSFNILGYTEGNRIESIEVNGVIFKGTEFRNKLGLRSADFDITKLDDGIIFTTRGYGHGVGMSQYGANGMAKNGYDYIEILKHYYPGTSLARI